MGNTQTSSNGGIGILGATFIVFLVLKLVGVIQWSWWWVTAPLWMPISVVLVACIFLLIGHVIAQALKQ